MLNLRYVSAFGTRPNEIRPGKKNVLVLVIGRVDFDANKKNAGRKINTTPRKIPSPVFSSPSQSSASTFICIMSC